MGRDIGSATGSPPAPGDQPFEIHLVRSGRTVLIPAGQSILDVVRSLGVRVASSCEGGTCGACRTRLLSGTPDHRDLVLTADRKADTIMVCVSRARVGPLVLDL